MFRVTSIQTLPEMLVTSPCALVVILIAGLVQRAIGHGVLRPLAFVILFVDPGTVK